MTVGGVVIPPSFDLTVPEDWSALPPTPGCAALVAEPQRDAFRCTVSLVFEELDGEDLALAQYARSRVVALADLLTDALLVDEQPATLAGVEAVVSTIGYRQGNDARTLRQWAAVVGGLGVLVGAVCSNDRFPGLQGTLDEIAESLVLEDAG
jgi:hypothetical protein